MGQNLSPVSEERAAYVVDTWTAGFIFSTTDGTLWHTTRQDFSGSVNWPALENLTVKLGITEMVATVAALIRKGKSTLSTPASRLIDRYFVKDLDSGALMAWGK
jgi:hypothetical protein